MVNVLCNVKTLPGPKSLASLSVWCLVSGSVVMIRVPNYFGFGYMVDILFNVTLMSNHNVNTVFILNSLN